MMAKEVKQMNNELTAQDLKKMQEELDYRRLTLMPELLEEVKRTRAFGDLSENYEYKVAKQEQNRNRGRIRYLERMIASARIIEDKSADNEVGLFDKVTLKMMGKEKVIQVVSTVRCDALHGLISLESPMGKAVLGRKVGDIVHVRVSDTSEYDAEILAIEKMTDDGSAPLVRY